MTANEKFQEMKKRWMELEKRAAKASGSCGWSSLQIDDWQASNDLRQNSIMEIQSSKLVGIEAALNDFEAKIARHEVKYQ